MKQQIRVLLADDHPMFLEGVRNALEKYTHIEIVGECTHGGCVEERISSMAVDVAVLDVNMPGKSGLALARLIRRAYPHIRVVLLTMYQPSAMGGDMLYSPYIHGYVLKNSGSQVLSEAITRAFEGKTFLDPRLNDVIRMPVQDALPAEVRLTSREKEIIRLIVEGKSNKEIAEKLFLSELTIKTHRKNIYQKLDVNNVAGLLNRISRAGILLDD